MGDELIDALAHELEARFGEPAVRDGGAQLAWSTASERIVLQVEGNRSCIVERHSRASDPEVPVHPRITVAW